LRNHHLAAGIALVDPREIDAAQANGIVQRIRQSFQTG
jgi:hypothetical protein